MRQVSYGFRKELRGVAFGDAVTRTKEALKTEGFGVLSEIDVQATLKAKLGVERPAYVILGACNPPFAHKSLTLEPEVGLLLPCNVVVAETEAGSEVQVADPKEMFKIIDNPELASVAEEIGGKLRRALERV
jgi:uncharacterized protein (DUF302 family)